VHLSPKAFDLLALLVRERPAAKSKNEIHQELWPETFVSDGNLGVLVTEIRDALADDARHPLFLRTVHRYGYAFCGSAVEVDGSPDVRTQSSGCCLTWGTRREPLAVGTNVVGREPSADVYINAAGVSRRHALLVVADEEVTVEDLGSKNGTFVNDIRVTGRTPLEDGAELRIGVVPVTFRRAPSAGSTQTLESVRPT
jgi:hypothetical protein